MKKLEKTPETKNLCVSPPRPECLDSGREHSNIHNLSGVTATDYNSQNVRKALRDAGLGACFYS